MKSLSVRAVLSLLVVFLAPAVFAHDVVLTGTQTFASLDGSASDHDGVANGVFTVNDGNLAVNGIVNCNDDGAGDSACAMAFAVSGNMTVNAGGALYAENRSGSGAGGAITLTVGGNFAMSGNAIVSTASKSSTGANGGAIAANVSGTVAVAAGSTIDSGSTNARGGAIAIVGGGRVTVNGNVISGPSRTILSTRLYGGPALDGGTANTIGGAISISSSTFAEPAILIGATANVVSQGADGGAGPVTLDGCGITIQGLVAALSRKDGVAKVSIRSGKDVLIDGRDLGATGVRMGRVRADAPSGTALNKGVDIFATETVDIHGPASGTLYAVTSLPGLHDSKSYGGLIRITSLADAVNGSGNMIDDGHTASGDSGGTIEIAAKEDVTLNGARLRAVGDFNTNNANRGGGSIRIRSHSGDVIWTNGLGEVRPVGSSSNLPLADQGSIVLTACGTVNTTGSTFPVMGTATSVFPDTQTSVCSPAAPSLPTGVPPLITCNTPPVANDASASTNEDTTVTITLSGSDADGDPLTFSIVSGPSHGTLGAIIPTGPTSATVNYSPASNYNGPDSFVFRADDGNGGTDDATVSITVVAVNDAPSFLAGPTVTVLEDSGPQTYANWATSISPGPADEAGQTVTFTVTNSDNSLFSVQPAVSSNGTLTFTPAANQSGSATITIVAHDDGGTANGGVDTSASQSSSITITAVNDKPSFTAGGDVTVNEDSAAYSAAWASAISAGPGETQNLTFVVTNDQNSFFSVQPAVSPTGVLTFTLAANANGSANVSVFLKDDGGTANGGDDTSGTQPFVITITAVNDAPSFTGGGDVSVLEDSSAYSAAWASAISAGPANESGQNVSFNVSNSDNTKFSVPPAIDPSGVLTFTVAPNAFGPVSVTVKLSDDGGTANGGANTSAPQTFTINIGAVNDAPSFTSGGNVTVNEDSGAYSASWATAISAGPNEAGQIVTFVVSNDDNALFSVQPSINSAGVLTFTPAPNAFGDATVTVYAQDNGGTANGGVNTSGSVTFVIFVNGVNDGPTVGNDAWETEGNTELRVDHGASTTPYVGDTTPSGRGVLDNDADTVEGDPIVVTGVVGCSDTVAPFVCAITGGTLTMEANGSFTFQPSPGAGSTSFQYTAADQPSAGTPASATGTVTLTVHDMIWYVNGAAPSGGNGTSASPFNSFLSLDGSGDVDGSGDYSFVHTSAVNGSIALEPQQKLWGEGVGLIIPRNLNGNGSPVTLVAAGVRPTVTSVSDTVTVTGVAGVDIAGLNLVSTLGNGIDISSPAFAGAASASVRSNSITAGQEGIDITSFNSVTTAVSINGTTILSAGNGVDVTGGTGTVIFSYSNGSITSTGGKGIYADGSSLDALYVTDLQGVTIAGNTAGNGIELLFARFDSNPGTAAFDVINAGVTVGASANPVGGTAILMNSVSGAAAFASLTAHGATSGVVISGTGLSTATTGFRISSTAGAISGAAGVGLSVTNASIASAGLKVTSISSTNGASGIVLNNTGTAGGLSVLGTGSANSGGTITGSTAAGVSLTSTANVSLNWMLVSNTGSHGIRGTQLSDGTGGVTASFSLANSRITSPGDADGESGLFFGNALTPGNNTGRIAVSNTIVEQFEERGMEVYNNAGSLVVDITGTLSGLTGSTTTFNDNNDTYGEQAVLVAAGGTAAITFNASGVYFDNIEGTTLDARIDASTAVMDINWIGNVSVNGGGPDNFPAGGGFQIVQDLGGAATYDIQGNTIRDISGDGIVIISDGPSTGRIGGPSAGQGNVISGSVFGDGIRIDSDQLPGGGNNYTVTVLIQNNNIGNDPTFPGIGDDGIQILHRDGTKTLNLTIEGNVIANTVSEAVRHFSDADVSDGALLPKNFMRVVNNTFSNIGTPDAVFYQTQETAELCLHMAGNTFSGANANIFLTRSGTGTLQITQASVAALAAANSGSTASSSGTIQFNGGCSNPALPTNP
jgi:Bacterial Ig domain